MEYDIETILTMYEDDYNPSAMVQGPRSNYSNGLSVDPERDSFKKISNVLGAYKRYRRGEKNPKLNFNQFFELYATENFATGGSAGQLVQPNADGSRPGYGGTEVAKEAADEFKSKTLPKYAKELETWIKKNIKNYKSLKDIDKMYNDAVKHFSKEPYTNQKFGKNFLSESTIKASRLKGGEKVSTFRLGDYSYSDIFKLGKQTTDATSKVRYVKDMMTIELINNNPKLKTIFTDFYKGKPINDNDMRIISRFNKEYLKGGTSNRPNLLRVWFQKLNPDFEKFRQDVAVFQDSISKQIATQRDNPNLSSPMRKKYKEAYTALRRMSDTFRTEFVKEFPKTVSKKAIDFQGNQIAKELFQWEHKAPRVTRDVTNLPASYLARTTQTPGTFNVFKMRYFDEPLDNLILKYELAKPNERKAIEKKIKTLYKNFNTKSGGYLEPLKISFNEKTGKVNLKDTTPLLKSTDYQTYKKQVAKNIIHADTYYKNIGEKKYRYDKNTIKSLLKEIETYVTDTTGKVKQPMLPSGLAGAYELLSDDLKAIVNSEGFKKFANSKAGKTLSMAAKTPGKLFGIGDVLLGYLDYTNNEPMMSKAKAWESMLQAMSFGIYRGGDEQNLKEIKEKFIANGGDGEIFDKVVDLNQSNFKMVNYMENMKKEYQDLTAAGYTNLAKDKMKVGMQNVAKMGNENLDKFAQYKTDLAVSEAGSPIQIKDVMQPARDAKKAAFDLFEEEQIKNFPTTSKQVNTESGPIAEKIYNSILTKDSYKKLLPQNWLSTFNQMIPFMPFKPVTEKEKEQGLIDKMEPRERYLYNLARGEDPDNPMTISETAKFMDKNKKAIGFSEGGITGLRSKYEYKK